MKKIITTFLVLSLFLLNACAEFADIWGANPNTAAKEKPAHVRKTAGDRKKGMVYVVEKDETMQTIAQKYNMTPAVLAEKNNMAEDEVLYEGQRIYIPTKKQLAKNIEEAGGVAAEEEKPKFMWPIDFNVSSGFGPRRGRNHDGVDIPAPTGTPVKASRDGSVLFQGKLSGYGNLIIVKHSGNYFTAYAHLSVIKVKKDQKVKQGDLIGNVGHTGRAKTPHLHFEIRYKTQSTNPLLYLPKK
ncbi:LysM peptidoglycan-binding domain-containing M23 family metallopeptidase [bacterium]|nr:LysM peptidoglycan-binding domain-containing M23 family metallopeptidase [bacterium]